MSDLEKMEKIALSNLLILSLEDRKPVLEYIVAFQRDEKKKRAYYQSIVYDVCNVLDRIFLKRPGRGVVCGTADSPSKQVQEHMATLAKFTEADIKAIVNAA